MLIYDFMEKLAQAIPGYNFTRDGHYEIKLENESYIFYMSKGEITNVCYYCKELIAPENIRAGGVYKEFMMNGERASETSQHLFCRDKQCYDEYCKTQKY